MANSTGPLLAKFSMSKEVPQKIFFSREVQNVFSDDNKKQKYANRENQKETALNRHTRKKRRPQKLGRERGRKKVAPQTPISLYGAPLLDLRSRLTRKEFPRQEIPSIHLSDVEEE